jgi:nitrogen fixation protein NifU and related proteins
MLEGRSLEEAMKLTRKDVIDALGGLSAQKRHAAALAVETLHQALSVKRE